MVALLLQEKVSPQLLVDAGVFPGFLFCSSPQAIKKEEKSFLRLLHGVRPRVFRGGAAIPVQVRVCGARGVGERSWDPLETRLVCGRQRFPNPDAEEGCRVGHKKARTRKKGNVCS